MTTALELSAWPELEPLLDGRDVVVEFWQDNCIDCRIFDPIWDEQLRDKPDDEVWVKVHSPTSLDLVDRFRIRAAPTLVLLRDGTEVARLVEPARAEVFTQALSQLRDD